MHRRRFLSSLLLTSIGAGTLVRPERAAALTPLKIAVALPGWSDEAFWITVAKTMTGAASQLGIELQIDFAERNRVRHAEQMLDAIRRRPDYVILVNQQQAALPALDEAARIGTRLFLAFSGLNGVSVRQYGAPREHIPNYLGSLVPHNEQAGYDATRLVIAAARAGGRGPDLRLGSICGLQATAAGIDRLRGTERAIREDGKVSLLHNTPVDWSQKQGEIAATALIKHYPELDAVICANDPIALGALKALTEAGRQPGRDIFLSGLNWLPEALQAVADGRLVASMGGNFLVGALSLVMLRDHADGFDWGAPALGPGATERRVDFEAVTSANVAGMITRIGDETWPRIRFDRLRNQNGNYDFALTRLLS